MSETEKRSKLLREIFPDTESGEEENDPIKYNKDVDLNLENDSSDSESEEYVLKPTKSKKNQSSSMSANLTEELPSATDAINEFYKLKEKFESEINKNKKTIINNSTLSNREKRSEFLKLMPKCVNCKRPSKKGTIFSITYHPSDDKIAEHRVFKAICGNLADPCNLNIEVNIGIKQSISEELNNIRNLNCLRVLPNSITQLLNDSKITNKIKSGQLKESELIEEATEMLQHMKNMPGMKQFESMFGQFGNPNLNQHLKKAKTKDRLRAKLAKREANSKK
jgi:hypothetical protein